MRRFHQEVRQFPNWNENPPGKKPQMNLQRLPREGEGGQNGKSNFFKSYKLIKFAIVFLVICSNLSYIVLVCLSVCKELQCLSPLTKLSMRLSFSLSVIIKELEVK